MINNEFFIIMYRNYWEWLNFHVVHIFAVFVEGPIHLQYSRNSDLLYE